jgi:hypothetical protein
MSRLNTAEGKQIFIEFDGVCRTLVPAADNLIKFELTGQGAIVGVDNGQPD